MSLEELRDLTLKLIANCKTLDELEAIRRWVFAKHK